MVSENIADSKKQQKRSHHTIRLIIYAISMLLWIIVALFLSRQWVDLLAYLLGGLANVPAVQLTLQAVEYTLNAVITIGLPLLIMHVIRKVSWRKLRDDTLRKLGLTRKPTWTDVALGGIGVLATIAIAWLIMSILGTVIPWFGLTDGQAFSQSTRLSSIDFILIFIALVIIAPVSEEILFRGWMYGTLRRLSKTKGLIASIVIVSLLFGFVHGQANVGIVMIIMSIIMCILREHTGTIWAGIFLHIFKNGIALTLLLAR